LYWSCGHFGRPFIPLRPADQKLLQIWCQGTNFHTLPAGVYFEQGTELDSTPKPRAFRIQDRLDLADILAQLLFAWGK
jgi:hypothetical protein